MHARVSIVHELLDSKFELLNILNDGSKFTVKVGQELALAKVLFKELLHECLIVSLFKLFDSLIEVFDLQDFLINNFDLGLNQVNFLLILIYMHVQLIFNTIVGSLYLSS